ncbi:hypothetical protein HWV62_39291 [Athelia sp. TMB]|nr:hypothetical protein HWV62_39291 [Athelia sp. TMB]
MSTAVFLEANGSISPAGNLIKRFFVSENLTTGAPAPFVCKLAPVFPQKDNLADLDVNIKVMVGVVNKKLEETMHTFRTFEDVQGMLNANMQVVVKLNAGRSHSHIPEMLALRERYYLDFRSDDSLRAVDNVAYSLFDCVLLLTYAIQIAQWMKSEFIEDPLLLKLAGLDDVEVIKSFASFSSKTIKSLKTMLVVNRYPSKASPYLKLHRIKLGLWLKEYKIGNGVTNSLETGITGAHLKYTYEPSESIALLPNLVEADCTLREAVRLPPASSQASDRHLRDLPTIPAVQPVNRESAEGRTHGYANQAQYEHARATQQNDRVYPAAQTSAVLPTQSPPNYTERPYAESTHPNASSPTVTSSDVLQHEQRPGSIVFPRQSQLAQSQSQPSRLQAIPGSFDDQQAEEDVPQTQSIADLHGPSPMEGVEAQNEISAANEHAVSAPVGTQPTTGGAAPAPAQGYISATLGFLWRG